MNLPRASSVASRTSSSSSTEEVHGAEPRAWASHNPGATKYTKYSAPTPDSPQRWRSRDHRARCHSRQWRGEEVPTLWLQAPSRTMLETLPSPKAQHHKRDGDGEGGSGGGSGGSSQAPPDNGKGCSGNGQHRGGKRGGHGGGQQRGAREPTRPCRATQHQQALVCLRDTHYQAPVLRLRAQVPVHLRVTAQAYLRILRATAPRPACLRAPRLRALLVG